MNQQKHVKSSSMFLLELILAIFFFSLASAVCVQIFVKSHLLSSSSQKLNFAVNECCSVAELLTTSDSLPEAKERLELLYPLVIQADFPAVALYYDKQFEPCLPANAVYQLHFVVEDISEAIDQSEDPSSTFKASLTFEEIGISNPVYTLDVTHHIAKEVSP